MASPQVENGAIQIAHDLYLAILQKPFTGLEYRVIGAIIGLTYGVGKTKAEIKTEDIRYLLGAETSLKTQRINEAINKLLAKGVVFRQMLINGSQLLGIQKDYEKWDILSPSLQDYKYIHIPNKEADKMSAPERLVAYGQKVSSFKYSSVGKFRKEKAHAKQLYIAALSHTRSSTAALYLLRDFIDENQWMRENAPMMFTYMSSRFGPWLKRIPKKPQDVAQMELATGKRWRYNVSLKSWEEAR